MSASGQRPGRRPKTAAVEPNTRFAVLMSIQPRFADAILDGTKTIELRRRPPQETLGIAIIYSSGKARSVQGVVRLKRVHISTPADIWKRFGAVAGVTRQEFFEYFDGAQTASAIELDRPLRGKTSMSLDSLRGVGLEPPQSWRYVDEASTTIILRALSIPPASQLETARPGPFRRSTDFMPAALLDFAFGGFSTRIGRPMNRVAETARCIRRDIFGASASLRTRRTQPRPTDLQ